MRMTRGEATVEILSTPTACSGVDGEVGSAATAGAPRSLEQRTGEKEEAVVGWALGTVHLGQCTVAFSIFFLQKGGFSNILSFHKILQKCETWSHNYFAISSTATKSLGIFGLHLNLFNNEKGILKAVFALLKCIRPI